MLSGIKILKPIISDGLMAIFEILEVRGPEATISLVVSPIVMKANEIFLVHLGEFHRLHHSNTGISNIKFPCSCLEMQYRK